MKRVYHPLAKQSGRFVLLALSCLLWPNTLAVAGAMLALETSILSSSEAPEGHSVAANMKATINPGIFFISNAGGTQAIWTVPSSGGAPDLLLSYPDLNIKSVNISPTGDSIAFITHDLSGDYNTGIMWTADIDGQNATPIPVGELVPHEPTAWSPDGKVIVFPTHTEGLYRIDRDGTNLYPLTPPATSHHYDDDPDVSVKNQVVYNNRLIGEIRVASLSGAGNLIRSLDGWSLPQWSPDGKRILYNELGVGLRIMNPDGTNDQLFLAEQTGEDLYSGDWSPEGILYMRVDESTGKSAIWAVNADGSSDRQLTSGSAVDERPQWGPGEGVAAVKNWLLFR